MKSSSFTEVKDGQEKSGRCQEILQEVLQDGREGKLHQYLDTYEQAGWHHLSEEQLLG